MSDMPSDDGLEEVIVDEEIEIGDEDYVEEIEEEESEQAEDNQMENGPSAATLSPVSVNFNHHDGAVFCCSIDPSSQTRVVTGGEDDKGYMWDIKTGVQLLTIDDHTDSVTHASFNHDGSLVATADMAGKLQVYKVATNTKIWETVTDDLFWAAWHRGANVLFAGTQLDTVYMWRIPSGVSKVFSGGTGAKVDTAVVMPDGKRLCVALSDGVLKVVDLQSTSIQHRQSAHNDCITSLVAHHDNILAFSGSTDGTAKLFNTKTGNIVTSFSCSDDDRFGVECVQLSPDPSFPVGVTATLNGTVQVWDLSTQATRNQMKLNDEGFSKLCWHPGGSLNIYAGSLDGRIVLIDIRTGTEQKSWRPHLETITDLAISNDGNTIVSASEDGSSRVLDVRVG